MLCTNTSPAPVLLMELAFRTGFANLLMHQSFGFFTQSISHI
jgi:hypothetical protein